MFSMARDSYPPAQPSSCSESKILPSMTSGVSGDQLTTETPPQTPPNKMTSANHQVDPQQQQQSYQQHQPSNLYSYSNIQSYDDDKSNMYSNDSINNLYNNTNNTL